MDKIWSELSQVNDSNIFNIETFLQNTEEEVIKPNAEDTVIDASGGLRLARKRGRPRKAYVDPEFQIDSSKYRMTGVVDSIPIEELKKEEEKKPVIYGVKVSIEYLLKTNIVQQDGPNAFSCPYVYDIMLHCSELGPNIDYTIQNKISSEFLNQEIQGKMLTSFVFEKDTKYHLGEIINDYVSVQVPVYAKFKIYRIGDIIEGKLKIINRKLILENADIICEIYLEDGIVSLKNNKNCFIKNDIVHFENSIVRVRLVSILPTTKSIAFITYGVLHEVPKTTCEISDDNESNEA